MHSSWNSDERGELKLGSGTWVDTWIKLSLWTRMVNLNKINKFDSIDEKKKKKDSTF